VADPAFMHPNQKAWRTEKTGRPHKYDPERAKQLLKESGYKGEKLVLYSTRDADYMANATLALQQQLQAVGINTEIQTLDFSGLVALVYAKEPKYQLALMSSSGRYDPDHHYYRRLHSSVSVNGYSSPGYDKVVESARATMDRNKRMALYDQAQEIMMNDVPMIMLFHVSFFDATRDYVKDYRMSAGGLLRLWNVWLDK
jgi:ABC-type transport system substrate-binding protein